MGTRRSRRQGRNTPSYAIEGGADTGIESFLVDDGALAPLVTRPSVRGYFRQLYERRHFIYTDARSRAFYSDRDLLLGRLWLILQPLLNAAMYGFMFGFILKTSRGIENFVGFLVIGITFFGFITALLNTGNGLIKRSRGMISSFQFPKAALVLSASYRTFLNSLPQAVVAIIVALAMQLGRPVPWTLILVVPLFFMLHLFGTGLMFLAARATAQFPDARILIQVAARAWFFISGVFFSIERFVDHPEMRMVMELNPAYVFLQAIRDSAMYNVVPELTVWLTLAGWSFLTLSIGFLVFWQAEDKYINVK